MTDLLDEIGTGEADIPTDSYRQEMAISKEVQSVMDRDWAAAQIQKRKAINSGFDPEYADAQFVAPIKRKWDIAKNAPPIYEDPEAFKKFNDETNSAILNEQKLLNTYSRDNGEWARSQSDLKPTFEKWEIKGGLMPKEPEHRTATYVLEQWANNPLMQKEEQDALAKRARNVPIQKIAEEHPLLFTKPWYSRRWKLPPKLTPEQVLDEADIAVGKGITDSIKNILANEVDFEGKVNKNAQDSLDNRLQRFKDYKAQLLIKHPELQPQMPVDKVQGGAKNSPMNRPTTFAEAAIPLPSNDKNQWVDGQLYYGEIKGKPFTGVWDKKRGMLVSTGL